MALLKLAVAVVGGSAVIVLVTFGASIVQRHEGHVIAWPAPAAAPTP